MQRNIQINTTTNKVITNNNSMSNQKKLPIPKHLTDKEKRNLMIAWARTHNKIDQEAGTITYPSGAVGKLKPKENKEEMKEQEANEDNEPIVSKMDKMTPKERANHDRKLNLYKKAQQMNKEDEHNKRQVIQPNLFEAFEESVEVKPKYETSEITEKYLDAVAEAKLNDFSNDSRIELDTLNERVNPMVVFKAAKVIAIYTEAGIYKLSDIIEDLYEKYSGISKELFDAIKDGYAIYYNRADNNTAAQMDNNIRNISYEFFVHKFKMEQSKLTDAETLGRKQLMKFLETLILNFKSKGISSQSLMGVSKAYYLLDNYKKITYEGYLRLESNERDEEGDLRSYVFRIDSDEAILSYEGYVHDPYGGDSLYEEMFNFDYNYGDFDDPEVNISNWIEEFESIFNNNGSLSIDDSTEEIEEIDEEDDDDYDREDDEQEEE